MSMKFDKKEIVEKGQELQPKLADLTWDLAGMKNSISLITGNAEFQGAFADSTKSYYSEVHIKAVDVLTTIVETLNSSSAKLIEGANALDPDSNAKIETDYIAIEKRDEWQTIQDAYTMHKSAIQGEVSSISDIVSLSIPAENFGDKSEEAKRELQTIMGNVYNFSYTSVITDVASLLADFNSLLGYMDSCQTSTGDLNYKAGDLEQQPFCFDLNQHLQIVRGEQLNKPVAEEEITQILNALTPEEKKTFYKQMCKELGIEFTESDFGKFAASVGKGTNDFKEFWDKLCKTLDEPSKKDYKLLRLIKDGSNSEVFLEMVARNDEMAQLFLKAVDKTKDIKQLVRNGAADFLFTLALRSDNTPRAGLKYFRASDRLVEIGKKIANGEGTFMKTLRNISKFGTIPLNLSKTSTILKFVNNGLKVFKESKWGTDIISRVGNAAPIIGWGGCILNTGINAASNWEKTDGDVGRTITHTAIDAVVAIGPLEGMQAGMLFGSVAPGIGTAAGAGVGFLAGGVWQFAQWGVKTLGFQEIKDTLKKTVGNAVGDGINWIGNAVSSGISWIGNGAKGIWENLTHQGLGMSVNGHAFEKIGRR